MGEFNSKLSLIMRLFMKYFISIEVMAKEAPKMWKRYYTIGDLKIIEINKEKRLGIIRLENFRVLPEQCNALEGFFSNIVKMVVGSPVTSEETKCIFRGDDYHEFVLRW